MVTVTEYKLYALQWRPKNLINQQTEIKITYSELNLTADFFFPQAINILILLYQSW